MDTRAAFPRHIGAPVTHLRYAEGHTMQYPLYIQRDGRTGFRGRFPDFPGAEVTGRSFDELELSSQQAVEALYHGSEQLIPGPTCDTSELRSLEVQGAEGIWLFVNINMSRVKSRAVSVELSLNAALLEQVNRAARERHLTRSGFFTVAAANELDPKRRR